MESPAKYFQEKICSYFLEKNSELEDLVESPVSLINLNKADLKKYGDLNFVVSREIWKGYVTRKNLVMKSKAFEDFADSQNFKEGQQRFLDYAAKWKFPVVGISLKEGRCFLSLDRCLIMKNLLCEVFDSPNEFGYLKKNLNRLVKLLPYSNEDSASVPEDLTNYRAYLLRNVLENVLQYSNITLAGDGDGNRGKIVYVEAISKNSDFAKDISNLDEYVILHSGLVLDPLTKKRASLTTSDYETMRSNEIHLMAVHKYGIRMTGECFIDLINRLGKAAVKVDLLEVKHSSPVHIIRNGQGSTKGASFILYNSARVETLLRTFEERVNSGSLPNIPNIREIDFSLLKEEEEWQLAFGYIMDFPNMIESCVKQIEQGVASTHLIIRFLSGFVSLFSCYYRRTRILTAYRPHLLGYIHARIYLVKAIREILNKTLALLNIAPVTFM